MKVVIDRFVGEFSFLSNFYCSPIMIDGMMFNSVEHAYQAAKTDDANSKNLIKNAKTPGIAKKLGQSVEMKSDWDDIKFDIMKKLIHEKFRNPFLREALIATSPADLIEGNHWNDTYWGVCRGVGANNLGKILMSERQSLIKEMMYEKE